MNPFQDQAMRRRRGAGVGSVPGSYSGDAKNDIQCPECGAGYRRIEVSSMEGQRGEYRCLTCDHPLEAFTGQTYVTYRLTVQPEKVFDQAGD